MFLQMHRINNTLLIKLMFRFDLLLLFVLYFEGFVARYTAKKFYFERYCLLLYNLWTYWINGGIILVQHCFGCFGSLLHNSVYYNKENRSGQTIICSKLQEMNLV